MTSLRLFWRGLAHLWTRWMDQLAPRGSGRSLARMLGAVGLAIAFALLLIACAGAIAWSFLALATSAQEARSISLLAVATVFSWMSAILIVLSAQVLLAVLSTRLWGRAFHSKPEPLVAATGAYAFGVAAVSTFARGLDGGAVLAVQAAGVAIAAAFFLLALRVLRATPGAIRTVHGTGFEQLTAHEKLAAFSKSRNAKRNKP
jgi:hypothetical protein